MNRSPFIDALGQDLDRASSGVKQHFSQSEGVHLYRGTMRNVWRRDGWQGLLARPFLWLGSLSDNLFPETGTDVPFELENSISDLPDGRTAMRWSRTFYFKHITRRFYACMVFDAEKGVIVDLLGKDGKLEVELCPRIEHGSLCITSRRQWMKLGPLQLRVPPWFAGEAHVREWDEPGGTFGISVTIHNPLLGPFFGYQGTFAEAGQAWDNLKAGRATA
ncbi:MAG: DUF4166 domain-containing protein [Chloroflexia bacterium]